MRSIGRFGEINKLKGIVVYDDIVEFVRTKHTRTRPQNKRTQASSGLENLHPKLGPCIVVNSDHYGCYSE
ncbi:hypothetical protein Hdeb2414_s0007g00238071 [Helianthus debilis subsp. tardiflorus]